MAYSIKALADLAGVSRRTLRYYDEIGLLKPMRINASSYRLYGEKEVDLLQQILLYKAMGMKLQGIQKIVSQEDFDIPKALKEHHQELIARRNQLDQLISTLEKSITYHKGDVKMSNKEKFEGFKKEKLTNNEKAYGQAIREKYGEEAVEASNKKFMNMSEEAYKKMKETENQLFKALKEVILSKDLGSDAAKNVFDQHKSWLNFTWPSYSVQAHIALAEMYVSDEEFTKYYNDQVGSEGVTTLRDIIVKYAK